MMRVSQTLQMKRLRERKAREQGRGFIAMRTSVKLHKAQAERFGEMWQDREEIIKQVRGK